MARSVGAVGVGIESSIGSRDELIAAGASEVYPGVAEFVDALLSPARGPASAPARPSRPSGPDRGAAAIACRRPRRRRRPAPGRPGRGVARLGRGRRARRRRRRRRPARGEAFGLAVDRWVGDGDSTDAAELEALAARGVAIDRVAVDKDESDTELALLAAVDAGADLVTILGGLGGVRVDHAIANLALLQHPALENRACPPVRRGGRPALAPRRPGSSRAAGRARAHRPRGRPRVAHPARRIGPGRRDPGPALPAQRARRSSSGERAACRTSGPPTTAWVSVGSGRLLVIETPANLRP